MKEKWRNIAALLVVCVLVLTELVGVAWAVDLQQACSITVKVSSEDKELVDYVVVDLYHVANAIEVSGEDRYTLEFIDPFMSVLSGWELLPNGTVDLSGVENDRVQELSQAMIRIIQEGAVEPVVTGWDLLQKIGGWDDMLKAGMYLIVPRGRDMEDYFVEITDEEGNTSIATTAKTFKHRYTFKPELVTVPTRESEGGKWVYDVECFLKPERDSPFGDFDFEKVDSRNHGDLAGAKFKLYCSQPITDGDWFTVYVEGMGEITLWEQPAEEGRGVVDGCYVTDGKGPISISKPTDEPYTLYALVEVEAPEGYELLDAPTFFFVDDPNGLGGRNVYYYGDSGPGSDTLHFNQHGAALNIVDDGEFKWITVESNPEAQPVYVRIRVLTDVDYCLGDFPWWQADDGWWYYREVLGAEPEVAWETAPFGIHYGGLYTDEEWGILRWSNVIVEYQTTPVLYDGNGKPYADWDSGDVQTYGTAQGKKCYAKTLENMRNHTVTIDNAPIPDGGDEMPETGGIGTTVFIVAGGVMIAGALFLLAVKKAQFQR